MRKFNTIIINDVEIKSNGFYIKKSSNLFLESINSTVLTRFKKMMGSKKRIKSIAFECGLYKSYYAGNFIITDIANQNITLLRI